MKDNTMLHLLKIDLKKMTSYRTFWVVCGLYFLTLGFGAASGMEFLKWLSRMFGRFDQQINIDRIPLYHFPDIWLNLIWCAGLLKVILGVMVVISVTNEFAYRTARQNIIDGLSRPQFLWSKILTNMMLSLMSVAMIFVIALVAGMIYSPSLELEMMVTDMEFLFAYFLELFFFLSYAMMLGFLIQRAGLSIILLLLSQLIEFIITSNIDNYLPWLVDYFPMNANWSLIELPFPRYALMEIKDYISLKSVAIVGTWTFIFNYLSYLRLKRADI